MKKLIVSALALTMLTSGFGIAKMPLPQEKFNYQNALACYQQSMKESNLEDGIEKMVDTIFKDTKKEENESHLKEVQISSLLDNDISVCNSNEDMVKEIAQDDKKNASDLEDNQISETLNLSENESKQDLKDDASDNNNVKVISKLEEDNSEKVKNVDEEERAVDAKNADQIEMIENINDALTQDQNEESESLGDEIDEQDAVKENIAEKEDKKSFKDLLGKRKKHLPKKIENAFREKVKPRKKEKLLSLAQNLSLFANADEGEISSPNNEINKSTDSNKNIEKVQKENGVLNAESNGKANTTTNQKPNATVLPSSDIKNSFSGVSTLANESQQNYCVTVIGNATSSMKPDKAYVSVQIETLDSDMKKSKDDNFALFDKITNLLKENGLNDSDIVFDSFYSYPNYDYSGTRTLNGYYCQTTLTFAVNDLENLQNLISIVSESGITKVSNIRYEISTKDQVYSEVMLKALENAKEKAKALTGKEDLSIKSIKEESVYSSSCLYKSYYEGANIADFLGDIEVEARVVVEFE
mgnify:FL=1